MLTYAYTILYVKDVDSTLSFFEKAFGFKRKFITPEKDYAEMLTGTTTLALASQELGKSNLQGGFSAINELAKPVGIELAFVSDQLDKDWKRAVDAGASVLEKISSKPWGQRVGYLTEANGCLIEMCDPMPE